MIRTSKHLSLQITMSFFWHKAFIKKNSFFSSYPFSLTRSNFLAYQFQSRFANHVWFKIECIYTKVTAKQYKLVFCFRVYPRTCTVNHKWTLVEDFHQTGAHLKFSIYFQTSNQRKPRCRVVAEYILWLWVWVVGRWIAVVIRVMTWSMLMHRLLSTMTMMMCWAALIVEPVWTTVCHCACVVVVRLVADWYFPVCCFAMSHYLF